MKYCIICASDAPKYIHGNPVSYTKRPSGSKVKPCSLSMDACNDHAEIVSNLYNEIGSLIYNRVRAIKESLIGTQNNSSAK